MLFPYVLIAAAMAAAAATDFPSDTLLPARKRVAHPPSQAVETEIEYAYSRDGRDWLHATATWSDPRSGSEVRITDREGRYRGGSRLRPGNALITYEAVYGPEGRMDQRIARMGDLEAVEHYRYDSHGNAVEKLTISRGDTTDREYYPHTYDAFGRIATRADYDGDSLNSTSVFRYDSLGRLAALVEYLPPWILLDSAVYEYRADGKVQGESHYPRYDGSPAELAFWEYRDWQVPLGMRRGAAAKAGRGVAGPARTESFDPAGRRLPDRPAAGLRLAR